MRVVRVGYHTDMPFRQFLVKAYPENLAAPYGVARHTLRHEPKPEIMAYHRHKQIRAVRLDIGRYRQIVFGKKIVQKLPKLHTVPQAHERVIFYFRQLQSLVFQFPEVFARNKYVVKACYDGCIKFF